MKKFKIDFYDKKLISPKNRFQLKKKEYQELKKNFNNSKVLIIGAAGSIGSFFCKSFVKFNYKKLVLIDKDENALTELNRDLAVQITKKKLKKINYICYDLNELRINDYLIKNKFTHYLNFAAIKHVRSEDDLLSAKYMFKTNANNFLEKSKILSKNLKQIFSISTDKAVSPFSLLGVSKKFMEYRLSQFKSLNKKIRVSSVRFANVSFSNGSILKNIVDKIENKQPLGVPQKVKRFFITHQEAVNLCLKSLLNICDCKILIPETKLLGKQKSIEILAKDILNINKLKITKNKKKHLNKNLFYVKFSKILFSGQKNEETLITFKEKNLSKKYYNFLTIPLEQNKNNLEVLLKKLEKAQNLKQLKSILKNNFQEYVINKNRESIKNTI